MRIGVISDSHGNLEKAQKAVDALGQLDILLHAGDHYKDLQQLTVAAGTRVFGVKGNCDFSGPKEQVLDVDGFKLLLTHGHDYGVKRWLGALAYRAEEVGASIVVYGHTHVAHKERVDGILLFNPGSVAKPRGVDVGCSAGLLEIAAGKINSYIFEI